MTEGYMRDRSFYASRPSGGRIVVHRESTAEPEMAACHPRGILLVMDHPWDIEQTRRDLCRRCWRTA